jgi:hypothetical protein
MFLRDALRDLIFLPSMLIYVEKGRFRDPFKIQCVPNWLPKSTKWRSYSFETVVWQSFVSRLVSEEPFRELQAIVFLDLCLISVAITVDCSCFLGHHKTTITSRFLRTRGQPFTNLEQTRPREAAGSVPGHIVLDL